MESLKNKFGTDTNDEGEMAKKKIWWNYDSLVGSFKNGYYDGELYIMTLDNKGVTYDWFATGVNGSFKPCVENKISTTNKKPVWEKGEDNDHSTDDSDDGFHWMTDKENANWGIYSLKKPK